MRRKKKEERRKKKEERRKKKEERRKKKEERRKKKEERSSIVDAFIFHPSTKRWDSYPPGIMFSILF